MLPRFYFKKLIHLVIAVYTIAYVFNTINNIGFRKTSKINQVLRHEHSIKSQYINNTECSNNSIWIKLNKNLYLKRTSFFYLNDFKIIRFSYLIKSYVKLNLSVDIKLIHKKKNRVLKFIRKCSDIRERFSYHRGLYQVKIADIQVDLSKRIGNIEDVKLFVNFVESNSEIREPIRVVVKNLTYSDVVKSSTVLCSKIFFLNELKDYLNLRWWIDLNLQIGHQTVSFYENFVDMDFFQDKKNYIEAESFRCFPNFLSNRNSEFLNSLKEIKYNNVFSYASTDIINVQVTNECYMRHAHSVKYVALLDNDETIIPRVSPQYFTIEDFNRFVTEKNFDQYDQVATELNKITCDRYDSQGEQMQAYLDELAAIYQYRNFKAMFFQQAFYFKKEMIMDLFEMLEQKLNKLKKSKNILINLQKLNPNSPYKSFNLTFRIENDQEMTYAKNLIKCFKNFIQPFIEKNYQKFSNMSENFQRFFALISFSDNQFLMGKTIHASNHSHPLCVHTLCGRRDKLISYNYGHLSHFRGSFKFKKHLILSIRQLVFDLNYFKCFVEPLLNLKINN